MSLCMPRLLSDLAAGLFGCSGAGRRGRVVNDIGGSSMRLYLVFGCKQEMLNTPGLI
jgi:hypothetical protein